jgi:alpha-tubulin suppressor-like RCC1 family protein
MHLKRLSPLTALVVLLLAYGCSDSPIAPGAVDPRHAISHAPTGGAPGFFWLPPMVSSTPSYSGVFDPDQPAVVEIFQCNGRNCAELSKIATSGAELPAITIIPARGKKDPYYTVEWWTRRFSLDLNSTYRVIVSVQGNRLGFADVWLVSKQKDLSTVDSDNFVGVVDGSKLDISFRIEATAPPPLPNQPPAAAITSPAEGTVFLAGASILFTGSASDPEDGALSGDALLWTSDRDGQIGTGTSFSRTDLSLGTHLITLSATDSQGLSGSTSVTIHVSTAPPPNQPPAVAITAPAEDAVYTEGDEITFSGSAIDPEDGALPDDALVWTSSLDGPIGTGASFTRSDLSVGTHTITLTATDGQGLTSTASVTIQVVAAPPPAVTPIDPRTISAGRAHSCGLTTSGRAYCWGENSFGQIGVGNWGGNYLTPVAVQNSPVFTRISAGGYHTCGLATDGRVYCWGYGSGGRLGTGGTTSRYTPWPVAGDHRFTTLSVGHDHTCAVSTDDEVLCWGINGNGRLGDGTTTGRNIPTLVAGTQRYRTVAAGTWHTCAISTGNEAYCWGLNNSGNLGDGTTEDRHTPTAVIGGLPLVTITVGERHSCALSAQGDAYCWGGNVFGQVGSGVTSPGFAAYTSPQAVVGGLRFSNLSAGYTHTCGVASNRQAYCWGNGQSGQFGDGTTPASRSVPGPVAGALSFAVIAGGYQHTCAFTMDDLAYCWGNNGNGRLGDGTTEQRLSPTPVSGWGSLAAFPFTGQTLHASLNPMATPGSPAPGARQTGRDGSRPSPIGM